MDQPEHKEQDVIGVWHLETFVTVFEDGSTLHPYGARPEGRLVYTASGFMSAHLWDPERHRPGAPDGTDAPYFSYCGDWVVEGDIVRHHVHAATHPGWTGVERLRTMRWHDELLELTAEGVAFAGKRGRGVLIWRNEG